MPGLQEKLILDRGMTGSTKAIMSRQSVSCRICANTKGNKRHLAREMMFGLRDEFEYVECANCGCLQIKEIPHNLSDYYPEAYYSFQQPAASLTAVPAASSWRRLRKYHLSKDGQIRKYYLNRNNVLGLLLEKIYKYGPHSRFPVEL
jgi:hypothetical protein